MFSRFDYRERSLGRSSKLMLGLFIIVAFLGFNLVTASAATVNVSAPQSVNAVAGPKSVTVSWSAPAQTNGFTERQPNHQRFG